MALDANVVALIQRLAIFFPCFLLALTFHEFCHAWMAQKFGDQTAAYSGRLTLNPIAHIDPVGTIFFPLLNVVLGTSFIGWAKPVPVDARNFKRHSMGMFWVAAAGPLSNIFLGFVSAFALVSCHVLLPDSFELKKASLAFASAFLELNFVLALFNLIPIPPLDGSQMLISFLPYNAQRQVFEFWDRFSYLLFFLVLIGGFAFLDGPLTFLMKTSVNFAGTVFGLALPARFG